MYASVNGCLFISCFLVLHEFIDGVYGGTHYYLPINRKKNHKKGSFLLHYIADVVCVFIYSVISYYKAVLSVFQQPFMGDNYCDAINNRAFCNYDGGDCCHSTVKTKKVCFLFFRGFIRQIPSFTLQ